METSDSECFESADEEFYSENEGKKAQKEDIKTVIKQIEELNVETPPPNKVAENSRIRTVKTKSKLGVKVNKVDAVERCATEEAVQPNTNTFNELKDDRTKERDMHDKVLEEQKKDINLWEDDDDWEPVPQETKSVPVSSGWGSWGTWDVSSLLTTATASVTTITNHVSQGLTSVLETGIGAPNPEELARINASEKPDVPPEKSTEPTNLFGLSNFVSGVSHITKLVETTGNKVVKGGLDTLETIGKKTMEVLQEGDPGFKKKRAFLKIDSEKPVLSHILREAKEKAEVENKLLEAQQFARKANYESLFDDHQGLVHLEALEMLSKQCDIKLQSLLESLSGSELVELQETLTQIEELCELVEEDEELDDETQMKEKLDTAMSEMNINISFDKLWSTWNEAEDWLNNLRLNVCSEVELHEQAIDTLARLTALGVERYHKIGELLLVKEHRSTADEADSLVQLTTTLTMLTSYVANKLSNKLSEKLTTSTHKDEINKLITNIYFESANSCSYVKNAFQLLIPVLQVGAI